MTDLQTYQVIDWLTESEKKEFNVESRQDSSIRAILTGETRYPKKDEWFIAGAVPEAYRASQNLRSARNIAKLVKVRIRTSVEIIQTQSGRESEFHALP